MELKEGRMYLGRLQKIDRTLQRKIWQLEECRASLLPRAIQYGKAKVKMPPKDYILETEAKIEELEEENYNQIDNYLSNTISLAEEKRQRILRSEVRRAEERPSVRARLREGKAKMEAEKQRKAMMTRQRITEKTK